MEKPIQESLEVAKMAHQEINQLLKDPKYVNNRLSINSLFEQMFRRFDLWGGILEPKMEEKKDVKFPPMTSFMGKPIEVAARVTQEQLNPKRHQVEKLRERVKKLYDEIVDLPPSAVLKSFTIPEDVMVVRGVAKWAGIKDFEKRDMNEAFVKDIIEGVKAKKLTDDTLNKAKNGAEDLKQQQASLADLGEEEDDIDGDSSPAVKIINKNASDTKITTETKPPAKTLQK